MTNHDVKAIEYVIKRSLQGNAELAKVGQKSRVLHTSSYAGLPKIPLMLGYYLSVFSTMLADNHNGALAKEMPGLC